MPRRKIPSFSSLLAFESAARHLSFKQASIDLNITQAAISRQIKLLEIYLGVELFIRVHRAVKLTPEGYAFYLDISKSFDGIEASAAKIVSSSDSKSITIGVMSSFASLFLAPRIGHFTKMYPEISLYIVTLDTSPTPQDVELDMYIAMGACRDTGYESTRLFNETIYPVCSPEYLNNHGPISSIKELNDHQLLTTDDNHWKHLPYEPIDWKVWLKEYNITHKNNNGLCYSNYTIMINTALSGHGICLGWHHLVIDYINKGLLVRPVGEYKTTSRDHHLFIKKRTNDKNISFFKEWIIEESKLLLDEFRH